MDILPLIVSAGGVLGTVIATLWGWSLNQYNKRHEERTNSNNAIILAIEKAKEENAAALKAHINYQQVLIETYKKDLDELQTKHNELIKIIHPAMLHTNKILEDFRRILEKL